MPLIPHPRIEPVHLKNRVFLPGNIFVIRMTDSKSRRMEQFFNVDNRRRMNMRFDRRFVVCLFRHILSRSPVCNSGCYSCLLVFCVNVVLSRLAFGLCDFLFQNIFRLRQCVMFPGLNLNRFNRHVLIRHPVPRMLRPSARVRNVQLHIPRILTELVHQLQIPRKLCLPQQKRNQFPELRFVQRRLHPGPDPRKITRDRPDIRVKINLPAGSPFRIQGNRIPRKLQPVISRHPRPRRSPPASRRQPPPQRLRCSLSAIPQKHFPPHLLFPLPVL